MQSVADRPWRSKIHLIHGYYMIRIDPGSDNHSTFLRYMGLYRSRVRQQGDCKTLATIVRAMNDIVHDIRFQDLIIYIDAIIISSTTYKEHVEAVQRVLQALQHQQFWLKQSKCQFCNKRL